MADASTPVVRFEDATLGYTDQPVWRGLSVEFPAGVFVAILGPNGSGKTSLLRAVLGLLPLQSGRVEVFGAPPRRGNPQIGYVPQAQAFDRDVPLRGRDLVGLGLDGYRWGFGRQSKSARMQVQQAISAAGADDYADVPLGRLSGGEQQRLRIAQALVGDPQLLLCDEPLAHLDLRYQQEITELMARWSRDTGRTVLFVTHDVNPILDVVDRVLFVVNGRWATGAAHDVLTTEQLTKLYGSHVDVLNVHGRLIVVGETLDAGFELEEAHHLPAIDDLPHDKNPRALR